MRALAVLVVVVGCGSKKEAPVDKQAVVDKPAPADAAPAPVAPLVMVTDDGNFPFTLGIAFEGKYPQLPAVNPDGTLIAVFESNTFGPMPLPPVSIVIRAIDESGKPEKVEILDEQSAEAASQIEDWAKTPGAQPVIKTMRERAARALALLHKQQFGSLIPVDFPIESSGVKKPVNIGDMILASNDSTSEIEAMSVSLTDAKGAVVASEIIAPYSQGTYNIGETESHSCGYRPMLIPLSRHRFSLARGVRTAGVNAMDRLGSRRRSSSTRRTCRGGIGRRCRARREDESRRRREPAWDATIDHG